MRSGFLNLAPQGRIRPGAWLYHRDCAYLCGIADRRYASVEVRRLREREGETFPIPFPHEGDA